MSKSTTHSTRRVRLFLRRWAAAAVAGVLACGLLPTGASAIGGPIDWTQSAATGPTPSVQAYLSYDSARNRTVLFGGAPTNGSAYYSDTWEFDGTTWSKVATTGPSGRALGQMIYDSARGVSVLFGGGSATPSYLGETWEWNGSAWTQRFTANAPAPRLWFGMTYDSARQRTVLFGGAASGNSNLADTWEYDGNNWTQVATVHTPPGRYGEGLAFDSARNRVVMFGGHNANRLNDTWEYNGSDWTQVTTATSPAPRFWHSMGYDPSRQRTVIFGGDYLLPNILGPNNETWEYDGGSWSQLLTTTRPSPRIEAPMAYDSVLGGLVIFGGSDESGRPDVALGDTWLLGNAIPAAAVAALSVASVTFPQQPVLTTANRPVSLVNNGNAPLNITSISGSGDFGATDGCPRSPATLAAGSSCTITVSFSPTTGNGSQIIGSLTLADDAGTGTQSIPLFGSGSWGFLSVSPSLVDFGSNQINPSGATAGAIVTITAPAQPTVITAVEVIGPFVAANLDCPLNTPISQGATCRIQVGFTPSMPGSYSGQLVIHNSEPGFQRIVALSGVATPVPPPPLSIRLQLSLPATVAHVLNVLALTDAGSGQATFTLAGKQLGGPIELTAGYAAISINLDDSVIPAGAGTYPLVVSVHSTDPNLSDASITQLVTVQPETVSLSWSGTSLGTAGQIANLSVHVEPAFGDADFVDFNTHAVWARFEVIDGSGSTLIYFARVQDIITPGGYYGQGVASVTGPALVAGAYQVRVRLVDAAQSSNPNPFASSEDLRTALAAHPVRGGWLAGVGQQSSSLAFDFTVAKTPAGSVVWVFPTQVVGADGEWHNAYRVYSSTSVQSLSNHKGTAVVSGQMSGAIIDANTGQDYPGFDVATTFTLTTDPSGNVQLLTGNNDYFSDKLSPVGVINHL
jgi:Galactose oxidase, central domain